MARFLALIICLAVSSGLARAQTAATGTIEGIVTDQTGGVLPGVGVVVRNLETNLTRELVTDGNGRYRAAALPPGVYEVSATLSGLEAKPITDIRLLVGTTVPVDVQMRPAGVAETVTVTSEAPLVDTRRTDVSNVVSEQAIENLPINGRRWENFVLLSPGVTNDGGFGLVSYRGISGLYNNNTVDGADNNQAFFSEARGRTRVSYAISQAAIREFQVGISNFSAEFGRAAGGTVNAVTKSGTNRLRGDAFYFRRDDEYMAREPFQPSKPNERRQQFGGNVGGPIVRDRIFYFLNYDQQLRDYPYFVRTFSATFLDQTCTAPGCAATRAFFDGLSTFLPREGNNKIVLGKIDAAVGRAHYLTVQHNLHRWTSPNGVRTTAIQSSAASHTGTDIVRTDFLLGRVSSVLGPRWLNELRVQVGRDFEAQVPNAPGPETFVTGGISFGMPDFLPRDKYPEEWRYQIVDNVSWYARAHALKAGIDINYVREDIVNLGGVGGVYRYPSLQAIATDCPVDVRGCVLLAENPGRHYTTFTQAFDLRGLRGDVFFTTTDYNFFIQDNWQVSNQLMLNLGLRYEYQQLPQPGDSEVRGIPFTGNPAYPATQRFNQDRNNWGPRAGFTYDVAARHQMVVRGGLGVYYGRTSNSAISSALTNNAVTFATYVLTPSTAGAPTYPNVLGAPPTIAGVRPRIQYLSPDLERPEIYMGDVSVDRHVGRDVTLSAAYLFSKGRKLPTFVDTNVPTPSAQVTYFLGTENKGTFPFFRGARLDPRVDGAIEVRSAIESQYHGLVLQAHKRFSRGLLFNVNYTLSKATDNGQNSTTFIGTFSDQVNPFDLGAEKGPSNFDRRRRFVASFHYAPGFLAGVQIGGVFIGESGLPVTAHISGSVSSATGAVNTSTTNGSGADRRVPFLERNSHRQSGRRTVDLRLSKPFNIGGRRRLVALWEAFNLFNWTNFTSFSNTLYRVASSSYDAAANMVTVNLTEDTGFLRPTAASNTIFGPRDMQLGIKFYW